MANTDFGILLKTLLDKSGINSELEQVQKIVNKYSIDIMPELKTASLRNQMKAVSQEIANDFNKAFGTNLTGNDVFKAFENQAKQAEKAVRDEAKAIETARKEQEALTNAMAKGREQAEQSRQAEEKRQQLAQNNAINKALEQEYQERQKNIEAARKQAELDKQNALAFTKSASERLSSAISKYSYGDTSDANAMMKQMNRGLSNFGDLSNVQGNITQLSSAVDKIIADLKLSHEQSLQALNQEIKAEQTLQSQKDAFNKKNLNAIDYEIQKREQEAKTFSSMLQAQMQEQQKMQSEVNKIQLQLDTEEYSKDIAKIDRELSKVGKFTLSDKSNVDVFDKAKTSADKLKLTYDQLKKSMSDANLTDQQKIDIENQYQQALERTKNLISQINLSKDDEKVTVTDNRRVNMVATLTNYLSKNTAMTKASKKQIKEWIAILSSSDDMTVGAIKNINSEFKQLDTTLRATGKLGLSVWDKFKQAFEKFGGWSLVTGAMTKLWQETKNGVQFIVKLDDALTDVAYTSNVSKLQLEDLGNNAIDMAKDLNTSAENILEAVKIYSTANATAADILRKSKPAIMLSNISGMSGSESSKTINTALNQFELEDTEESLMDIVDTYEYVASQLNYDFTEAIKELNEGIEASGSVAKNAGLNMQEYATMVGIAVEKTGQSGSTIGK